MIRKLSTITAISLTIALAAATSSMSAAAVSSSATIRAPVQSRCLTNAQVERVMRSRFRAATEVGRPSDFLLDTLSISGSTFTLVTSDSICALARTTYIDIYHGSDSTRKALALAGFSAVMVVELKPNRYWIATTEYDEYQLFRRVLVDSTWKVVTKQL